MLADAVFRVEINGVDYTDRFQPLVKTIEVVDKDGLASDTCQITLADVDGAIVLPSKNDRVKVSLGRAGEGAGLVFSGYVSSVRSTGARGGGRELEIGATGVDSRSKAKQPMQKYKDDAKFGDVAKEWGQAAGLSDVVVPDGLASIQDGYWAMQDESFIHWGQRMARDLGATFKIQDGKGIFVETNGGQSASGKELSTIGATWGSNLLTWEISPVLGRLQHKRTRVRYYSTKEAKWKEKEVEVGANDTEAEYTFRFDGHDEDTADRKAQSLKKRFERNGGEGQVVILGTSEAKPEGTCIVTGTRPGIDGTYRIEGVTHRLTKSDGYTTTLDLRQPQGEAGKDSRGASTSSSSRNVTEAGQAPGNVG